MLLIRTSLVFGAMIIVSNLSAQVTSFNGIAFGTKYDDVKRNLQLRGYDVPILEENSEPFIAMIYKESLNGLSPDGILFNFSLSRELVAGSYMWSIKLNNTSDEIIVKELLNRIEDEVKKKYGNGNPNHNREQQLNRSLNESVIWNKWEFKNGYEGGNVDITIRDSIIMLSIVNIRYFIDQIKRDGNEL